MTHDSAQYSTLQRERETFAYGETSEKVPCLQRVNAATN